MSDYGKLRWALYRLDTGHEVYLTQRPDRAAGVQEFVQEVKPQVRFNFCDDWVELNPDFDQVPWHWLAWFPCCGLPLENLFTFFCHMSRLDTSKPIWMHCDSSSMRAPTFLGLWLYATQADSLRRIVDSVQVHNQPLEYAGYANPERYANTSFNMDFGVKEFIESWSQGELHANSTIDRFLRQVRKEVKKLTTAGVTSP